MIVMLTGCTSAGTEVVLESTVSEPVLEVMSENPEESFAQVSDSAGSDSSFPQEDEEPETVVVYVCGAVKEAGVYELPGGSRLNDAVKAAGGLDDEADRTYVNLAAICSDGMKLYIPTFQETEKQFAGVTSGSSNSSGFESYDMTNAAANGSSESVTDTKSGLVNINTASKEELTSLSGIGAGYADRIIAYRNEKGPFKSIEDIMKVSGIKEKLFSRIKDYITV